MNTLHCPSLSINCDGNNKRSFDDCDRQGKGCSQDHVSYFDESSFHTPPCCSHKRKCPTPSTPTGNRCRNCHFDFDEASLEVIGLPELNPTANSTAGTIFIKTLKPRVRRPICKDHVAYSPTISTRIHVDDIALPSDLVFCPIQHNTVDGYAPLLPDFSLPPVREDGELAGAMPPPSSRCRPPSPVTTPSDNCCSGLEKPAMAHYNNLPHTIFHQPFPSHGHPSSKSTEYAYCA